MDYDNLDYEDYLMKSSALAVHKKANLKQNAGSNNPSKASNISNKTNNSRQGSAQNSISSETPRYREPASSSNNNGEDSTSEKSKKQPASSSTTKRRASSLSESEHHYEKRQSPKRKKEMSSQQAKRAYNDDLRSGKVDLRTRQAYVNKKPSQDVANSPLNKALSWKITPWDNNVSRKRETVVRYRLRRNSEGKRVWNIEPDGKRSKHRTNVQEYFIQTLLQHYREVAHLSAVDLDELRNSYSKLMLFAASYGLLPDIQDALVDSIPDTRHHVFHRLQAVRNSKRNSLTAQQSRRRIFDKVSSVDQHLASLRDILSNQHGISRRYQYKMDCTLLTILCSLFYMRTIGNDWPLRLDNPQDILNHFDDDRVHKLINIAIHGGTLTHKELKEHHEL